MSARPDAAEVLAGVLAWAMADACPEDDVAQTMVEHLQMAVGEPTDEAPRSVLLRWDGTLEPWQPAAPPGLSEEERAHADDLRRAWTEAAPTYPGDLAVDDIFWLLDRLAPAVGDEKEDRDG